jgi:uncharacterized membrane protein YcaP (DUF421 family)
VKSEPTLLVHHGTFLDDAMREQRVTREEVLSVLRKQSITAVKDAVAVVLETDGSFSVISAPPPSGDGNVLLNVAGAEAGDTRQTSQQRS